MNQQLQTIVLFLVALVLQNKKSFARINSKKLFQLKLFWEEGIIWQGTSNERSWCAECENNCEAGEYIEIKECNDRKNDQKWIMNENRIRPSSNTEVCFTIQETREKLKLENCDHSLDQYQLFSGTTIKREFQIHPLNENHLCLTQHHHPKSSEKLMITTCQIAESNDANKHDDTSLWEVGTFEGHDGMFLGWFDKLESLTGHLYGHRQ